MLLMDLNEQADKDFGAARRRAWMRRLGSSLRGKPAGGPQASFRDVQNRRRAHNRVRRGVRTVDVDRIVGSVGRSKDFDSGFLPLRASTGARWKRVDVAFHRGADLPPVSLYEIEGDFFVLDGNHRVSVARFHGLRTVEAEVTELLPPHSGSPTPEAVVLEARAA
ncbi:MAG TPA: hypothetical protein VFY59_10575 [Rubrobacter sp.]|nr:hypothetical protein [Rubrobacter sp.]